MEEDVVTADPPQRREVRPTVRFSPADYDRPRAPASARKPKRGRADRQGRGRGQGEAIDVVWAPTVLPHVLS